jgi:hypothetical protein
MADRCVWTGASGRKYTFYVYARHPRIIKGQMGGYIYAKIDQDNTWQPIYIGQGDIGVRCTQSHHQIECIDSKGATHVHLKITADECIRKSQERDLLAAYPQAYAPTGCNQQGEG